LCLTKVCKKQKTALLFSFVYAFATAVWSITSRGIWQHGPSLFFITLSLFILYKKNEKFIPYSGFLLGFAVFNRPTNILIALPLTVYVFFQHRKSFIKYILLASIPAFLLFSYSYIYLNSIIFLGQGQGLAAFDGNLIRGFFGLLISPARGLLIFSPIFIFSFIYFPKILFSKHENDILHKYLMISVVLLILFYSKWKCWWGGWSFGYRLLIEVIPMLIIILAVYWEKSISKNIYLKTIFIIFLIISVYFHFLGAYYYPSGFNEIPDSIDSHIERLWYIKDTELIRCTKNFLKDLLNLIK